MAPEKDKFDLLYNSFKDNFTRLFDSYAKVSGSYLVIIGWLVSSEKTLVFIAHNCRAYVSCIGTLVLISALYMVLCYRMYLKSGRLLRSLVSLNYMEPEFYDSYKISLRSFLIVISGQLLLTAITCVMLSLGS